MGALANLIRHLHGLRVQHLQARQALPLCFTRRYCSAHDSDSVPSADVEAVRDALVRACALKIVRFHTAATCALWQPAS